MAIPQTFYPSYTPTPTVALQLCNRCSNQALLITLAWPTTELPPGCIHRLIPTLNTTSVPPLSILNVAGECTQNSWFGTSER